nr:formimidoylglutamate deiminase [Pararhodobacter sp.]
MIKLWAEQALCATGWAQGVTVTVDGTRISAVETGTQPQPGDTRLGTLLPAPANLHSHAFQRAMAGMTERRGPNAHDSFWTWRQLMYQFMDQLTPDDVQAITAFVQMEMLEAGYGASVEFHYLHHAPGGVVYDALGEMSQRVVAAAQESGIGLTLLPVLYQVGGCDKRALGPGQIRFGNDPERYAKLLDAAQSALRALPEDAVLGVAPHSLRAVTPEGLLACVDLRPDAPIHIHLAEQMAEVEETVAAWGQRPVQRLMDQVDVDQRWCLIHLTQMERAETLALAATGAVAGLCPITESSLGDGIFDGVAWTGAKGRFGIGSDSNVRISLTEELRTLDYSQRLRDRVRAALATPELSTGRALFEGAALGGAQAAGRGKGMIAPGELADLVALDMGGVDLEGRAGDCVLDAWIFAGDDRAVSEVWSGGRHVVSGGVHRNRDSIEAGYRLVMKRLQAL